MNTQDKLAILEPTALVHFDAKCTLDQVCTMVVTEAIEHGIGFTEIMPLIKAIGKEHGFIVELADRKTNFIDDLENRTEWPESYDALTEMVALLCSRHDVPELWATKAYKAAMKEAGHGVPVKPQLSGWKLCALEVWQHPDIPTRKEVQDKLIERGFNHHKYTQAYHELFTALVAL